MNPDTIAQAKAADLLQLAGHYTKLTRASSTELQGPCPLCGGEDRFHVKQDGWFCRACHPKFGDAIEFVRWVEKRTFPEAVELLTGAQLTTTPRQQPAPQPIAPEPKRKVWNAAQCYADMQDMFRRLMETDNPGADYLNSRFIWRDTWAAFGLGYDPQRHAIAMPWVRGNSLSGIRYRFITPRNPKMKIISQDASNFTRLLFGGQAIPRVSPDARSHRHLLIVEGEINAMSAWQAMSGARLDVLSLGGESNHIPASFFPVAAQYRTRIVWMDKESRARIEAARIEAAAIWSEEGGKKTDANDHLRAGTLADVLALALQRAGKPEHAEALTFDLYDAA